MTRTAEPRHRVLLFVGDPSEPANRAALRAFKRMRWPAGWKPEVVDVRTASQTVQWYGIVVHPAVVVVEDGVLLAIEHRCTTEACQRLREAATQSVGLSGRV